MLVYRDELGSTIKEKIPFRSTLDPLFFRLNAAV